MKFIHIADVHLGAEPDIGSARRGMRSQEIWNSLERIITVCNEQRIELLLIAGDLFHRQPLKRELKELNALFLRLTMTKVVIIAGNHDYLKEDSYYHTFVWEKNVHMILDSEIACVEFPEYALAVYGMSYHTKEIRQECFRDAYSQRRRPYEILMIHGGDDKHIPVRKEDLMGLGYDYIAMGHIHRPQEICPGKITYAGALEPIDKNDTGAHGYVLGEITTRGCKTQFVPFALREYIHLEVPVDDHMTGYDLKEKIGSLIEEHGRQNIYKLMLTGMRDPEVLFDLSQMDVYGNVVEIEDHTKPAYQFERLLEQNRENILGRFIDSLKTGDKESMEYQALCEGVQALMETRRG